MGLEYNHVFSRALKSLFYFSSRQLQISSPLTGNLNGNSANLYSFGVGAQYWTENQRFGLGVKIGSEQVPFLVGVSQSQFQMNPLSVPQLSLDLDVKIYDVKPFEIGTEFTVVNYLPTNSATYQSSFNTGFEGKLFVRQTVSQNFRFDLGVDGRFINENTSISSQQQTDYGVYLKLSIPLGGNFSDE